jgi:hypothetical protein
MPSLKTIDYSSFTKTTALKTKPTIRFELCNNDDDLILSNVQEMINELQISINNDQIIPLPPPLVVLSQAIQRKYSKQ